MPSLYDKYLADMAKEGIMPKTSAARSWLADKISKVTLPSSRSNLLGDPLRSTGEIIIGRMYFFHYDPKYKAKLPVYDKFPLVIPIEPYSNGFLGINIHYLDLGSRLGLLDKLHDFINNDKYDDSTRFKLSYKLLSSSRRYKAFEQCVKRYLSQNILSSLIYIEPNSWDTAMYLPSAKMVYRR